MKGEKSEKLSEAVSHLLEECRMVLPGIQALFGFQLIAFFSQRFEQVSFLNQVLHLLAAGLIVLSAGLVMTPAAFHREVEPSAVSQGFLDLSTRLVLASMALLAVGISLDFFVVAAMVIRRIVATLAAICLFAVLAFLWFIFPFFKRYNGQ
jgi:putative Mn2+ efflux pump MntP